MNILADTQIIVWSLDINSPLLKLHRDILKDDSNRVFASHISLMELAIKKAIGKLPSFVPEINEVAEIWVQNGFEILPLSQRHIFSYTSVPFFENHRDPFDRFLIAVAKEENCAIMTADSKFQLYSSFIEIT